MNLRAHDAKVVAGQVSDGVHWHIARQILDLDAAFAALVAERLSRVEQGRRFDLVDWNHGDGDGGHALSAGVLDEVGQDLAVRHNQTAVPLELVGTHVLLEERLSAASIARQRLLSKLVRTRMHALRVVDHGLHHVAEGLATELAFVALGIAI